MPLCLLETHMDKNRKVAYLCGQPSAAHSKEPVEKICWNILGDEDAAVLPFS